MLTIVETRGFTSEAESLLSESDRAELFLHLALNPYSGQVIPGSAGCRKLRWALAGKGKRGGVRVVYVNYLTMGEIVMITIYAKSETGNIPAHLLRIIKETYEN